jgi:hypothetical protein
MIGGGEGGIRTRWYRFLVCAGPAVALYRQ